MNDLEVDAKNSTGEIYQQKSSNSCQGKTVGEYAAQEVKVVNKPNAMKHYYNV